MIAHELEDTRYLLTRCIAYNIIHAYVISLKSCQRVPSTHICIPVDVGHTSAALMIPITALNTVAQTFWLEYIRNTIEKHI